MHRPVLITPPAPIVTVEQAMAQCRISADALDATAQAEVAALLTGYIASATEMLDGYGGLLGGRCLGVQTWREDFDCFSRCIPLALGPVKEITSVTLRNSTGVEETVDTGDFSLRTDGGGRAFCRFRNDYSIPGDLDEVGAVSVTYEAGSDIVPYRAMQAILLMVGAWYENREDTVIGVSVASLPVSASFDNLVGQLRRSGL
ncbi:head-tail connector protein [Rhizobium halophytocola]|uniref:PhiE125 gp8 family phage protein n=1 Tax=Rhizobium halophytocola TaxID=735519 RepID=A0ABS4DVG5_9HYPH|nr:hypothetical protein [Rhizobium halophytocola]MBP1849690.1 putative phiE125 gp8 family phage protein [Rhizobium halophytocola]